MIQLWPMMYTGMVNDLSERVRRRELEFSFIEYEGERLKELQYSQIGQSEYRIVASSQIKKEALNSFIGSREIHDQTYTHKLPTFNKIKKLNRELQIKYSANDFMAYKKLILSGLGIGLLPIRLIKRDLLQKRLKVLYEDIDLSFPIFAVSHGSYPLSPEAKRTIELFKNNLSRKEKLL